MNADYQFPRPAGSKHTRCAATGNVWNNTVILCNETNINEILTDEYALAIIYERYHEYAYPINSIKCKLQNTTEIDVSY